MGTGELRGDRSVAGTAVVDEALVAQLTTAVAAAAVVTLAAGRDVRIKADRSLITDADEHSHTVLMQAVARLMPGVAVVSEEMAIRPSRLSDVFVLIDPLDGTREFAAGWNEYTVNLAVIHDGEPVVGIVAVPAEGLIYRGRAQQGAERLKMSHDGHIPSLAAAEPIRIRNAPRGGVIAAVSRSHLDSASAALLDRLHVGHRVACGSSLKFCMIAEGIADIYPRLATTCEWDVAAGHALVVAAGGVVTSPEDRVLRYGDAANDFRVPGFIAWGDRIGVLATASLGA